MTRKVTRGRTIILLITMIQIEAGQMELLIPPVTIGDGLMLNGLGEVVAPAPASAPTPTTTTLVHRVAPTTAPLVMVSTSTNLAMNSS